MKIALHASSTLYVSHARWRTSQEGYFPMKSENVLYVDADMARVCMCASFHAVNVPAKQQSYLQRRNSSMRVKMGHLEMPPLPSNTEHPRA